MSTFVELHLIQNFAPSCLNRDDTGAPKDAMFGGFRRSRISSQCIKRSIRQTFSDAGLLDSGELGVRTRNLIAILEEKLADQGVTEATAAIENALATVELKIKARKETTGQTEYLLFLGNRSVDELARVVATHVDVLKAGKGNREIKNAIDTCIGSSSAVDVALFGRMLADRKELNVDAAAQVAHAISTHRVDRESDFFTAVDDWTKEDEADAGMLGTVEFNSSCQYRYAVVHLDKLIDNLGGDRLLARRGLMAFLRASVLAIPTGRQNTFAAHNLPSFVGVTVHNSQPISLANAFENPVKYGEHSNGLTAASVVRLQSHLQRLSQGYGLKLELQSLDLTGAWTGDTHADLDTLLASVDASLGSF